MSNITKATTREELAALVTQALRKEGLDPVLVGGAVVSIYTDNKYESRDLDFIVSASSDVVNEVMKKMGFKKSGKNFYHPKSEFTVEFPMGPLAIGDQEPVKPEGELKIKRTTIKLLSPTQSVMDRLAWFFYSNDRQCLDQALWISKAHPVDLKKVEAWAKREGQEEKFHIFLGSLR